MGKEECIEKDPEYCKIAEARLTFAVNIHENGELADGVSL